MRPHLFLHRNLHQVFEFSYQGRRPDGLDPAHPDPPHAEASKFSIMPTLSWDRGTYAGRRCA